MNNQMTLAEMVDAVQAAYVANGNTWEGEAHQLHNKFSKMLAGQIEPSDNPAADAATQFDVMTKRGYKLNMLTGVYEK